MDCLNRHDYDRDKCLDFFQAYRDCKKTWVRRAISLPIPIAPKHANTIPRWNNAKQTDALASINLADMYLNNVRLCYEISRSLVFLVRCLRFLPPAYLAPMIQAQIRVAREHHR